MFDEVKQSKLFCFDIETIPDVDLARRHLGLKNESEEEVVDALTKYHLDITSGNNAFYRQLFHKIACISYVQCNVDYERDGEVYSVVSVASGGSLDAGEADILRGLFTYLNKERPRLASFNGRGFDLPVIKYRSMMHKIPAPWLYRTGSKWSNYGNRYSLDWHTDLLEAFSDFGTSARIKISEVASLFKIPCKLDGDGSSVYQMYKDGKIEQIRNYCEQDALCTFVLYLFWALHQSRISELSFNKSIENLENYIAKQNKLHLTDFASGLFK